MNAAVERASTFFDTADVYGDGRTERLLARCCQERSEPLVVATKFGRRAPLEVENYTYENLRSWLDRRAKTSASTRSTWSSCTARRRRLLHARRSSRPATSSCAEGHVRPYGVSVEKVEEALKAIEYPGVSTVQIIFNVFRQRPAELFFAASPPARCRRDLPACRWPRAC